jgi:hypothetical protein
MIHYTYRTYLTSTVIRAFELVLEPQIRITVFIDYIHDNTSSDSPVLTDQLTNQLNPLRIVVLETVANPHLSQKIPGFYGTKIHKVVQKSTPLTRVLGEINPVQVYVLLLEVSF